MNSSIEESSRISVKNRMKETISFKIYSPNRESNNNRDSNRDSG